MFWIQGWFLNVRWTTIQYPSVVLVTKILDVTSTARFEMRDSGCEIQDARFGIPDLGCEILVAKTPLGFCMVAKRTFRDHPCIENLFRIRYIDFLGS